MKIFICKSAKKIIFFLILALSFVLLPNFVFASSANGTINATNKYGWSENIGWINFGLSQGNIHITDSGLSGYAWSSNYGWINFNPSGSGVKNNGAGVLSGSAWGENIGWIDFLGVSIDSDGYFSGYANGAVTGRISFNCTNTNSCADSDFKVQTDWRSRAVRPQCNNASDDDNDGLIDYPNDLGCDSLEDNNEINYSYAASSVSYSSLPEFKQESTATKDIIPPKLTIDNIQDYYRDGAEIVLTGKTDEVAEIILLFNQEYILVQTDANGNWKINLGQITAGDYSLEISAKDLAGNKSNFEIIKLIVKSVDRQDGREEVITEETAKTGEEVTESEVEAENIQENVVETSPKTAISGQEEAKETILEKIENVANKIIEKIFDIIQPISKLDETKEIAVIPKEPPLAFKERWNLLPQKAIDNFALSPLSIEFKKLAEKFPELGNTFERVGIQKNTDLKKLKSVKLTLPGLTESVNIPSNEVKESKFAFTKSLPLVKLSAQDKQRLPTEIVFAKTGGELIDLNIALTVNNKGKPQQEISTISGKPLYLIVKPEQPVAKIRGYVVFRSKNFRTDNLKHGTFSFNLDNLLNLTLFAAPALAQTAVDANYIALEGGNISNLTSQNIEDKLQVSGSKFQETRLVLTEFEYTDPDGDGIYTAEIQVPIAEGEYEIITVMDFEDAELGKKEIRLITVVDPEGYIYEGADGKEIRIPGAIVSLYSLNLETKQYELWTATEYQQENPQITDSTGKYSFLVPEGFYYLTVEAPGYMIYEGKPFEVKEGSGIHENIELKTKYWWIKIVDWKTVALIAVILFLIYNFYRDRKRAKEISKS